MKKIKLTRGKEALVDDEDYEYLSQFKWQYHHKGYAVRVTPRPEHKQLQMHREILKPEKGIFIDHINSNGLDNRKENLRLANNQKNQWNSRKQSNCSSKYKGVCWVKRSKKWRASIVYCRKSTFLGDFENEIDAVKAYNEAAIKYFGDFAKLNDI